MDAVTILANTDAITNLPVRDIGRARRFYGETLGLAQVDSQGDNLVVYRSGDSRLLVNSTSTLNVGLSESLSIGTSFVLQYDSAPPPGKKTTDTALSANLQISF